MRLAAANSSLFISLETYVVDPVPAVGAVGEFSQWVEQVARTSMTSSPDTAGTVIEGVVTAPFWSLEPVNVVVPATLKKETAPPTTAVSAAESVRVTVAMPAGGLSRDHNST